MNNKERLQLIKELQKEIGQLKDAQKEIAAKLKQKKATLEDVTNNVINQLLREENGKKK